jgi:hypothetical protein
MRLISGAYLPQYDSPAGSFSALSCCPLTATGMEKGDENDEMRSQTDQVVRGASACLLPLPAVRRAV